MRLDKFTVSFETKTGPNRTKWMEQQQVDLNRYTIDLQRSCATITLLKVQHKTFKIHVFWLGNAVYLVLEP